jgi:putative toxin-antitoxin system antitoxin component (TIGR02293 family)
MATVSPVRRAGVKAKRAQHGLFYIEIYRSSPQARITMIRNGVKAGDAKQMISDLHFDQQTLLGALNLKTATVNRKAARDEALSIEESERVLGIASLVGQLQAIVEESGDPEGFDATLWLSQWLREPLSALGGEKPLSLLDTMEGQALVASMLAKVQSGAFA